MYLDCHYVQHFRIVFRTNAQEKYAEYPRNKNINAIFRDFLKSKHFPKRPKLGKKWKSKILVSVIAEVIDKWKPVLLFPLIIGKPRF